MGQGRLQPEGGEPAQGASQARATDPVRRGGVVKRKTKQASKASPVYERIRQILESARTNIARSVNTTQVVANWLIGREIVDEEQKGVRKAGYGDQLIAELSARLVEEYGRGYSATNL